jgi:hypothetical protein
VGVGVGVGEGAGVDPPLSEMTADWSDNSLLTAALSARLPPMINTPNAPMISAYSDAELPSSFRKKRLIIGGPQRYPWVSG